MLCIPSWPGTLYIDKVDLEFIDSPAFLLNAVPPPMVNMTSLPSQLAQRLELQVGRHSHSAFNWVSGNLNPSP